MANIKSAKKRILVAQKNAERNKAIRSRVKTYVKKVYTAVESGDKEAAAAALKNATVELDKAASKGVYHKNTTSRKISRLTHMVNKMAYGATPSVPKTSKRISWEKAGPSNGPPFACSLYICRLRNSSSTRRDLKFLSTSRDRRSATAREKSRKPSGASPKK